MSIRFKIGLVLGILLAGVLALNFILSEKFILPSFNRIEEDRVKVNVERFIEAYNNEFEYLSSKCADWSNWDDTYQFIIDRNDEYIVSNLTDVSVQNLRLDMMIFLDTKGEVVYQTGYDMDSEQPISDFSGWSEHIKTGAAIADQAENEFKKGLLMIGGRPVMFVSSHILTSDASGPSRGTIIFAKYLDKIEVEKLASLTRLEVELKNIDEVSNQEDRVMLDLLVQTESMLQVKEINSKYVYGYSLFKDFYEKPRLLLEVKVERNIYNQGMLAVSYFVIVSAVAGLALLIITSLLLERIVIKKIVKFNSDIAQITQKGDFSKRVSVSGGDEFSNMSKSTNFMLEALEKASYRTETEYQKAQAYLKIMGTMLVALDVDGKVLFVNEKALELLGFASEKEVVGKNWFERFIPERDRKNMVRVHDEIIKDKEKNVYHENMILNKKGEERLVSWHNAIFRDGAGKIIGVVSSGDDITEKRIQEEKEKELATELKRINELMIGRELRMVELKKENERLEAELAKKG